MNVKLLLMSVAVCAFSQANVFGQGGKYVAKQCESESLAIKSLPRNASAAQTVLGYCPDDIPDGTQAIGYPQDVTIGAAICLPAAKMGGLAGGKITKIRVGMLKGLSGAYVWIRSSLGSRPLVTQKIENIQDGWNEVVLKSPQTITGGEIFIGYSGKQDADYPSVLAGGDEVEEAAYLSYNNNWQNYYGQGFGSLFIQAVVEKDRPEVDLSVSGLSVDKTLCKVGGNIVFTAGIGNYGKNSVDGYSLGCSVDGKELESEGIAAALAPEGKSEWSKAVALSGYGEGRHVLKVYLKDASAIGDNTAQNDTASLAFHVYGKSYQHNLLVEHFTTIGCVNCPYGEEALTKAFGSAEDVVQVAHHVGYGEDELTIPGSRYYLEFGVVGAPEAMIDRTATVNDDRPPFVIGGQNTDNNAKLLQAAANSARSVPALAKVDVKSSYDPSSRTLDISVDGEKASVFSDVYPASRITVFVTENNVKSKAIQKGADASFRHNHVLRAIVTDSLGNDITWAGDKFSYSASLVLDEAWNASNMSVVAVVSKPFIPGVTPVNDGEVINSAQSAVSVPSSVRGIEAGQPCIRIENGRAVAGGCQIEGVFSADGRALPNRGLRPGLYLVKAKKAGALYMVKVVAR